MSSSGSPLSTKTLGGSHETSLTAGMRAKAPRWIIKPNVTEKKLYEARPDWLFVCVAVVTSA